MAGQQYLITTLCERREARFADWDTASRVAATLGGERLWRGSHPLCWLLMPDHMHLIVELGQDESLAALMRRVKCVTAGLANAIDRRRGAVWMPGYHDHALRSEESVVSAMRYIILNPVRAGIVSSIGEYPYWNCTWQEAGMLDWE